MADALDSGSSRRKSVWVQVPSSAPIKSYTPNRCMALYLFHNGLEPTPTIYSKITPM